MAYISGFTEELRHIKKPHEKIRHSQREDMQIGVTTINPAELDPSKSALQNQGAVIGRHEQLLHDMMKQQTLLVRAQTDGAQPASASVGTGVGTGASAAAPVLASPLPPTDPIPIRGDALVANPERYAGDPDMQRLSFAVFPGV
ncbi:hypothetical protein MHYP_G00184070 [Metynnis hypsauchen]